MTFLKANRRGFAINTLLTLAWAVLATSARAHAQDAKQAMFERVFGEAARLDPAMVAKVKALPPGERLLVDRDGDGRSDEAWFLDTARRHTIRPLLVRAIDEDGDLDAHLGPDLDSDLYLADWKADGTVDAAVDYQDDDGDNDVDRMGTFYWVPKDGYLGKPALRVWWGEDTSDDNLLWYDVDWTYYQRLCQYRCHFAGGKWFSAFNLTADGDRWIPLFENPFAFYDPDGDGSSEVVLRFTGLGDDVESLRYSFDADGDAYGPRAYDYELSITAFAEGSSWDRGDRTHTSTLKLTDEIASSFQIRGIPTGRLLRWDKAQELACRWPWAKACLTWDEMNANTEFNVQRDPHERWEGVIVHGSEDFPQIGGPPCSTLNKRNEIVQKPALPLRLYYDPTDHRLHLLGAGPAEGWIDVDYDLDGKRDARYTYLDENQDGVFDRRQIDLDADGQPEFDWKMFGKPSFPVELRYGSLSGQYTRAVAKALGESQELIDAAKAALGSRLSEPDPVETFFLTKLESWYPSTRLGRRMRSTPGGARLYVGLLRDRLLARLKAEYGGHEAWPQIEAAYAAGRYAEAAELVLIRLAPDAQTVPPERFRSFSRRLPIRIHDIRPVENRPVVLSVKLIQESAKDFNADNCAVVGSERWIDWREIPHQVDQLDASVGPELSFLPDEPCRTTATYYLYWSPEGKRDASFERKTGTDQNWDPGKLNVGWESNLGAYRAYDGMFDFFGKHTYSHSKKGEWMVYPIKDVNYHQETEWGVDALLVGKTSGLGGLTLYADDQAFPVQNPPGGDGRVKITKRAISAGPVRAAVEITARNVMPGNPDLAVRILCIIYAEHQESEILATLTGAKGRVRLAPGMTKLVREETFLDQDPLGCFGTWGYQDQSIGEVGMAILVPRDTLYRVIELPGERRLLCEPRRGALRYWIVGDWRRGRRFPVAPTVDNWRRQMQRLAESLHHAAPCTIESPEDVP